MAAILLVALGGGTRVAKAGIEDWELNEVVTSAGGDGAVRYLELANLAGGCLFPTSQVVVYDGAGQVVGTTALVSQTTCYGAPTYFLLATSAAVTWFGITADRQVVPALPSAAGQACFVSSQTRYDCVRWGPITTAVEDFFGVGDATSAQAPPDGQSLSRTDHTNIVSADWSVLSPTPRGPNDGTPWTPPDAGPTPDAGAPADAGPDAGPRPDAAVIPDARPVGDASDQRYLDLDPAGGALCSCRTGAGGTASVLLLLGAIALVGRRR